MIKRKIMTYAIFILFAGTIIIPTSVNINAQELSSACIKNPNGHFNNSRPNIMLTGYWNPTGLMIAPFSNNSYLNPDGWKGENWENSGYDIYSFFPTPGIYNGTFEVDYQKTWDDFWNITEQLHPIAIISFGAGFGPWEIEYISGNFDLWSDDNEAPYQPIPSPPDDTVSVGHIRYSTLPVQAIADAVNTQTHIDAWVDWDGYAGGYLCGYMAYLGMWYQALHNSSDDPYPCKAAGFIHVRSILNLGYAMEATKITIREVINILPTNHQVSIRELIPFDR